MRPKGVKSKRLRGVQAAQRREKQAAQRREKQAAEDDCVEMFTVLINAISGEKTPANSNIIDTHLQKLQQCRYARATLRKHINEVNKLAVLYRRQLEYFEERLQLISHVHSLLNDKLKLDK